MPVVAEDEQSFSVFTFAEDEQSFFFFFWASFWISFFRMLVGLEHGILICAMELQRRGGSHSEIWHLHFKVCIFSFSFLWISGLVFFYRNTFDENESSMLLLLKDLEKGKTQ